MNQYYSYHNHSHYSQGDSIAKVEDIIDICAKNGYKHVCITEHGNANSFADLWFGCKSKNLIPVLGCEVYVCDKREKIAQLRESGAAEMAKDMYRGSVRHLVVIAKNDAGYKNLMRVVYDAANNFYNKPLTTTKFLAEHSEGLIVTSACPGGILGKSISSDNIEEAVKYAQVYKDIFGDDFYIEIVCNDAEQESIRKHNETVAKIAKKLGIKTTIANDVHYIHDGDNEIRKMILALRSKLTLKDIENPSEKNADKVDFIKNDCKELFFMDADRLYESYKRISKGSRILTKPLFDSCLENNAEIFEKIGDFVPHIMSEIPRPTDLSFSDLEKFAYEGLKARGLDKKQNYVERLQMELDVIKKLKIDSYLLVLHDFVMWTKQNYGKTSMAPGRGSSAASLVLYCINVTEVDPIEHNLLFARFLDESKIESGSGPDVDLDFSPAIRPIVQKYIRDKYSNSVYIGTVQIYKWKMIVKDVLKYYDVPFSEANALTKDISDDMDDKTFSEIKEELPKVMEKLNDIGISDNALNKMHGIIRSSGQHPAGIIIGDKNKPLHESIPYYRYNENIVSGWNGDSLGDMGYYKYDTLIVSNVQVIDDALVLIRKNRGKITTKNGTMFLPKSMASKSGFGEMEDVDIDIYRDCNLYDPNIYEYANRGPFGYDSVFQFGTNVAANMLEKAQPKTFEDMVVMNSILRPATIRYGMTDKYIQRMIGREIYEVPEKAKPIVGHTHGIIVFQEQCMQACMELGGFTSKEANKVRKLLIKKSDVDATNKFKEKFIKGSAGKIDKDVAEGLWEEMVRMSEYAFCKAHAVSYTIIAAFDMWLKYYYGFEFYTAVLNNLGEKDIDKIRETIQKIYNKPMLFHADDGTTIEHNLKVLPPDINYPSEKFSLDSKYRIRYGLSSVKSLTQQDLAKLISRGKPFDDYREFVQYCVSSGFNRSSVHALVFCGACDVFEVSRNEIWLTYAKLRRDKAENTNKTIKELVNLEIEYTGIAFDLMNEYQKLEADNTLDDVKYGSDGEYEVVLLVKDLVKRKTKAAGKPYIMLVSDGLNVFVWNMERLSKDGVRPGETIKCLLNKKQNYVQYGKLTERIDFDDTLGTSVKYSEYNYVEPKVKSYVQDEFELTA